MHSNAVLALECYDRKHVTLPAFSPIVPPNLGKVQMSALTTLTHASKMGQDVKSGGSSKLTRPKACKNTQPI